MYLFISDIHGNVENLNKLSLNKYDTIFFLGDLYGNIEEDEDIKKFINTFKDKLICIKGNCDYEEEYLELGIPVNEYIKLNINNKNIYLTHGNKDSLSKGCKYIDMDILIYGHEHVPYIVKEEGKVYMCVGSIGKPRDSFGASYLELDNNIFTLKNTDNYIIDQIKISSN